jgi:hypothetical protein
MRRSREFEGRPDGDDASSRSARASRPAGEAIDGITRLSADPDWAVFHPDLPTPETQYFHQKLVARSPWKSRQQARGGFTFLMSQRKTRASERVAATVEEAVCALARELGPG